MREEFQTGDWQAGQKKEKQENRQNDKSTKSLERFNKKLDQSQAVESSRREKEEQTEVRVDQRNDDFWSDNLNEKNSQRN